MYRRERRRRRKQKKLRKLDWNKIAKSFLTITKISLILSLIVIGFAYYSTSSNNDLVYKISENPGITNGTIVSIHTRKSKYANYTFKINNITYTGSTHGKVDLDVNDPICVAYNKIEPESNMYCNDKETKSYFEGVFLVSLKIFGIMLLINILIILWEILTRNKKILAEITSKK